jgi:parvulin-like peptidyl-prolyl isomerase
LLTQEAQRTIPEPEVQEVARAFDKLKEEHGGGDQFYASMGLSPEQDGLIQRDLSVNLQVESLRDSACQSIPAPTEAECRAYYESHTQQFSDKDEVRASHIFKSVRETEKREAIFMALCEVRQRLVDGADFTGLARVHSDKPAEEIDLGFFKRGELMDEFEIVTFSMKEGEVSPVFATQHGFHLAKVTERKTGKPKAFGSVRADIEAELAAQRQEAKLQELVDELKKTAKINYIEPKEGLGAHNHE